MIELARSFTADLEVTGRTVEGQALTWDTVYRVSDDGRQFYDEGWRRRATVDELVAARNTFEFRVDHADYRIGLVGFAETASGLVFRAVVDDGDRGDSALAEIHAGRARGVSVLYHPKRSLKDRAGVVWRIKARIRELSLTDRAQYPDALVTAVRHQITVPGPTDRDRRIAAVLGWHPPEL